MLAVCLQATPPPQIIARALGIALIVFFATAAAGCVRGGFPTSPHPDAATDGAPGIDALSPAKLDGDCEPGNGCVDELVCTGLPRQRTCRPPCQTDTDCTGQDERCGQPQDLNGTLFPRACLVVRLAARYESCGADPPCKTSLACINMPGESFWSFCGEKCLDDSGCLDDESCQPILSNNGRLCLRRCKVDADCPGKLGCSGIGAPPENESFCLATSPTGRDEPCDAKLNVFCAAGHRCLNAGAGQPGACVPLCDATGGCKAGRTCLTGLVADQDFCFVICDPAAPTACGPAQICLPHAASQRAFCIAANGTPEGGACGSAKANAPCASGLLCVNKTCHRVCVDNKACTAPQTCKQTFNAGKPLPWKACL